MLLYVRGLPIGFRMRLPSLMLRLARAKPGSHSPIPASDNSSLTFWPPRHHCCAPDLNAQQTSWTPSGARRNARRRGIIVRPDDSAADLTL